MECCCCRMTSCKAAAELSTLPVHFLLCELLMPTRFTQDWRDYVELDLFGVSLQLCCLLLTKSDVLLSLHVFLNFSSHAFAFLSLTPVCTVNTIMWNVTTLLSSLNALCAHRLTLTDVYLFEFSHLNSARNERRFSPIRHLHFTVIKVSSYVNWPSKQSWLSLFMQLEHKEIFVAGCMVREEHFFSFSCICGKSKWIA